MTEIRRALPFLAFVLVLLLAGCSLLPPSAPTAPSPEAVRPAGPIGPGDLEAQRGLWQGQDVDDYAWEVAFSCECLLNGSTIITVRDGVAVEALNNGQPVELASIEGFPLTIDAVFDEARATLEGGGAIEATWGQGGLPRTLNLDRDLQAVDDELGITISSVMPAQ